MQAWPLQSEADGFYGSPRGRNGKASGEWEQRNLVELKPPFAMHYGGHPVVSIAVHQKCADSLQRVFVAIWKVAQRNQNKIDQWGVSAFGGSYNFRLKRNSMSLSMHAYGCAIDLAPERFPLGRKLPTFTPEVLKAFADEGWVNLPRDRMHFQAARLR